MYDRISWLRRYLLKILHPITVWIGNRRMPFSVKRFTGDDYYAVESIPLRPGMIFLTRTSGELSNIVNPGFWKHGAIYIGHGRVVEALGRGVVEKNLIEFLLKKDYVAALTPLFADQGVMNKAAEVAQSYIGSPYDFAFEMRDKAFYCYEVIYRAYTTVLGEDMPFKMKRNSLGVPYIIGDDFYNAREKWQCLWDNKD